MLTVLVPETHAAGCTEHLLTLPQSRRFGVRRVAAARNQRHWSTSAGAVWPLCPDLSLAFLPGEILSIPMPPLLSASGHGQSLKGAVIRPPDELSTEMAHEAATGRSQGAETVTTSQGLRT